MSLLAATFDVHLAHPSGLKALRKRKRVKTDPRDAYELATLLRLGSLPGAYIAPPNLRELPEKLATSINGPGSPHATTGQTRPCTAGTSAKKATP
jgi:hypothetical protein